MTAIGDDRGKRGDHGGAGLAREPGEDVGVPRLEDQAEAEQQDHRLRRAARDRQVAVDPRLQPRIALAKLGADAEPALQGAADAGEAEARGPGDDEGRRTPLDQEEEAVQPVGRGEQPAGDDVEDGRDVPEVRKLAEEREDPEMRPPAVRAPGLVQPARERRAVLQDEGDEQPDQEDAEQADQRRVAALRQAEEEPRLAEGCSRKRRCSRAAATRSSSRRRSRRRAAQGEAAARRAPARACRPPWPGSRSGGR